MPLPIPQPASEDHPFHILLAHLPDGSTTHFLPTARLAVTPILRTSGLLRGLADDEVKTLLLILTYLTPNGLFLATVPQMAEAMRVAEGKMEQRLRRLQGFIWQGEPLLREQVRENGLRSYVPSTSLVGIEVAVSAAAEPLPLPIPSHRDAVIAHSRAAYTHPRAEVERLIAEQNGWDVPRREGTEVHGSAIFQRLLRVGILPEQAEALIAHYPYEEIEQQLDWLPYRTVRKPAPFLIAAIENRYAEPIAARQRRLFDQAVQSPEVANTGDIPSMHEEISLPAGDLSPGETLAVLDIPRDADPQPEA